MSRTKRTPLRYVYLNANGRDSQSIVPAVLRRLENQKRRAKAKAAMRAGRDPAPEKHNLRWNYF